MKQMGNRIRLARQRRHLTQERLAELLDVSRSAIARWETGEILPSTLNLASLSKVLGVSSDYLLGLTDVASPSSLESDEEIRIALQTFLEVFLERIAKGVLNEKDNHG